MPGGAVVCRRKHKADTHCVNGLGNLLGRKGDIDAGRFQHIGAAGLSGRRAVAVFGHNGSGGTSHQGGGRGYVKKTRAIASRTDRIGHLICLDTDAGGKFTHHRRRTG